MSVSLGYISAAVIKCLVKCNFQEEGFIWLTDKGTATMVGQLRWQEPEVADYFTPTIRNRRVHVGGMLLNLVSTFCTAQDALPREWSCPQLGWVFPYQLTYSR